MAQIQSGASSDLLVVNPVSKAGRAELYDPSGGVLAQQDSGDVSAAPYGVIAMGVNDRRVTAMRTDRFGSMAQATHVPLFADSFEGTTISSVRWTWSSTTMTVSQTSVGGVTFNNSNVVTANTGHMMTSNRRFMKTMRQPLHAKFRARFDISNNSGTEVGFYEASSATATVTTGAYWQVTNTGVVQPVVTFNNADITGTDVRGLIDPAKFYVWDVLMDDDEAVFFVQDTSTGLILSRQSIKLPLTAARLVSTTQVPFTARHYNSGTAPATAGHLIITDVYVALLDGLYNMPASHMSAAMHRGFTENPFTSVQLAQWANSAEPTSATLSNTAAGYTTLGGKFQFAAVAGAATDYALFAYTPLTATLVITGIDIETWNTGAAVATTPTLLTWGLAVNSSGASLASSVISRVGLGAQQLAVGAAVGAKAERISKSFQTPLVCGPGRYVDVILRMPVGTATASQVIAGMVNFEGYFL